MSAVDPTLGPSRERLERVTAERDVAFEVIDALTAALGAARADAERLAAAANFAIAHSAGMYPLALDGLRTASAAHDALTGDTA